ncbi:MAG: FAD-dependent oxidoreductase [Vicinamibacteria bacterium]
MTHNADGDGIDRRDFLNGLLLAAGGAAVGGFSPMRAFAHSGVGINTGDGGIGFDPRARRGGNLPEVFNVGHWMRDERLTFSPTKVNIKPAPYDNYQGNHDIHTDNGSYDVIVVGSGMSGLSAAFYLQRRRPGTKVLLLDANGTFGGNAGRDDAAPIPNISATGGAYAVDPYADFLTEIYGTTGVDWEANYIADPFYSYFFDDRTPYVIPGTRSWTRDVYGAGTNDMPYPTPILNHLKQAKQDFRNWYNREGAPTDPADNSDPRFDYLAQKTLHEYLTVEKGFHPAVSDFYTRFAVDALSGTSKQVNAYTSISFIAAEYNPVFTLPGGTSGIARHILNWLIPAAIDGNTTDAIIANPIRNDKLDLATNKTRIRQQAMVVRADTTSSGAKVVYFKDGKFYRSSAGAVIMAGQYHTAHRVVEHLLTPAKLNAFLTFTLAPVPIANVTLKRARPLVDLGLGYNQYWWGSKFWADFTVADWIGPNRLDPNRKTVLTFYGANELPPEEMAHERVALLKRPFSAYENSLREDLERIFCGTGFDFDDDVSAVYLYRWGHGMVYPKVGFPFGPPTYQGGQAVRTPAPRHLAREPIGRISFAGQDVESSPAIESAIASGLRTADEAIEQL